MYVQSFAISTRERKNEKHRSVHFCPVKNAPHARTAVCWEVSSKFPPYILTTCPFMSEDGGGEIRKIGGLGRWTAPELRRRRDTSTSLGVIVLYVLREPSALETGSGSTPTPPNNRAGRRAEDIKNQTAEQQVAHDPATCSSHGCVKAPRMFVRFGRFCSWRPGCLPLRSVA